MAILTFFPKNIGDLVAMQQEATALAETMQRCSFDWDDNPKIPCIAGPLKEGKEMTISGGWELRRKCIVRVRTVNLPDPLDLPKTNDVITLYLSETGPGTQLRILSTDRSFDVFIEMHCVDTNHP